MSDPVKQTKQPRLLYLVLTSGTSDRGAAAIRQTWANRIPQSDALIFAGTGSSFDLKDSLEQALALPDWDLLIQIDDQTYAMPERISEILAELRQRALIYAEPAGADCRIFDRPALRRAVPFLSDPKGPGFVGSALFAQALQINAISHSCLPPFFHRKRLIDRILCGAGAIVQDMAPEDLHALDTLVSAMPLRPFEVAAASVGYGSVGLNGFLGFGSLQAMVNGRRQPQTISAHAPSRIVLQAQPGLLFEFAGAINDSSLSRINAAATFQIRSATDEVLLDLGSVTRGHATPWVTLRVPADGRICLRADTESTFSCHSLWLWRAPEWERENEVEAQIAGMLETGSDEANIAFHLNQTEPEGAKTWNAQAVSALRWRRSIGAPAVTESTIVLQLYQMLKDVHELFCQYGIDYWADFGTLLGAVRHRGLIPWDDDLDLSIPSAQQEELSELRPVFERLGYTLVNVGACWKIFPNAGRAYDPPRPWKFPFLDVFCMSRHLDCFRYTAELGCAHDGGPLYITANELLPLADYRFGTFSIKGPKSADRHLEHLYGADWERVASRAYDHSREASSEPVKILLSDQHRRPAEPMGPLVDRISANARARDIREIENPLNRDALLPLVSKWIELAKEHGIPYSIYWGTLLGQVRNQRIIPYDQDVDVVVGKSGAQTIYELPRRAAGCFYNDELKDRPAWRDGEIALVVRKDLISADGPRYAHDGRQVPTQVDSCAFSGPLARLVIKRPSGSDVTNFRHLDVDLFTDLSHFKAYPAMEEVDELPELEDRPLENLTVSCLKEPIPYLVKYYGPSYLTPDRVYRAGRWVPRSALQNGSDVNAALREPFMIVEASVSWGEVGRRGALGYEGHDVVVGGARQHQTISAHAPSQVLLRAAPGLTLEFTGAINDSSPVPIGARAEFRICARSGEVLAALGSARAQQPTKRARVCVPADGLVRLCADTESVPCCHSVWLWRQPD